MSPRLLTAFFGLLTAITWVLVVFGAAVRAHGAGLACPDWPLCFGELIPTFDFGVVLEWGHRLLAGTVSLFFVVGLWLSWRGEKTRRATWKLGWIAFGVLGLQVIMGGLTVLKLLASWTVTLHLLLGNTFCALLLCLTLALRSLTRRAPAPVKLAFTARGLVGLVAMLTVLQLAMGGLVSSNYAGLACTDWPACSDGVWFPTWTGLIGLQLIHRLIAYALAGAWLALFVVTRSIPALSTVGSVGVALVLFQAGVGVLNVLWKLPVEITLLHSAGATALVLLTTLMVWKVLGREQAARDGEALPVALA